MSVSPSSSAQAARDRVARRLRELRLDAGLTGKELARRCGWTHPKTSRLENARTPPTPADIRLWCEACGVPDEAADLIALSRDAAELYTEYRRRVRTGLRRLQESRVDLYQATELFRVYSPSVVPGLLQTEGYARAIMAANSAFFGVPDDSAEAAAARLKRSEVIHQPGRRCVIVMEESALYFRLGDSAAMAAQLGYLLTAGALPSVSLGIIPAGTENRPVLPQELFHIYDDALVSIELLTAQVTVTQPSEVDQYLRIFEQLRTLAVYGAQARTLIGNAIQAL